MILPAEISTKALVISTAGSASFGIGLASSHYLNKYKKEIVTQENTVDIAQVLKYYGATIGAYTAPAIVTCALSEMVMPGSCNNLNPTTQLSFANSECYSLYKTTLGPSISTTADIVIPFIFDIAAGFVAYEVFNPNMILSTVVTADWMSRLAMDHTSQEFKLEYIDPSLNYLEEVAHCGVGYASQIIGSVTGYFVQTGEL